MTDRRTFLERLSLLGLGAVVSPRAWPVGRPRYVDEPFTLGVASGDPWPDGFVLWTRLAPDPLLGGGMPDERVTVRWEVASDESMQQVVKRGTVMASPDFAHAVHVEVRGLAPDRWYWYRFASGDAQTPVARARTMPVPGARPDRLRLLVASCQHYEWGHFAAQRHMAREDADLTCFLGDYIYESPAAMPLRRHGTAEPTTLDAYRNRYALYKSDAHLQAAHATCPWIVTWDDHEVENNYAALVPELATDAEGFALRRAAAYRAFYEHTPVRRASIPRGPDMLLYRRLAFGQLATFHVLDGRQYRSDQACGDRRQPPCDAWAREDRTMLGATQERWLGKGLASSRATWNVLANQVVMTPVDLDPGAGEMYNMDSWSGYPAARRRLTGLIADRKVPNVITLTGDVHANYAGEVPADARTEGSPAVAAEYVATSLTSDGDGFEAHPAVVAAMTTHPWLKYHNARRGYLRCEITADGWHTDYRILPGVQSADVEITTHASFLTPTGASRVERA